MITSSESHNSNPLRLGFIRTSSFRRHNNDSDHQDRGFFQMHKNHKLKIRSFLGSSPERNPAEEPGSKEDSSEFFFDALYTKKELHVENKERYTFEKYEEPSPSPSNNKVHKIIRTIDQMPIPMKSSKRDLMVGLDDDKKEKEADKKQKTLVLTRRQEFKQSGNARSTPNLRRAPPNTRSAPDLRRVPPPGFLKRRNSVTRYSQTFKNARFD